MNGTRMSSEFGILNTAMIVSIIDESADTTETTVSCYMCVWFLYCILTKFYHSRLSKVTDADQGSSVVNMVIIEEAKETLDDYNGPST